jgi:hypothetical protein
MENMTVNPEKTISCPPKKGFLIFIILEKNDPV